MTDWNFADIYEQIAAAIPDAPCQVSGDRVTSWGDFDRRANAFAADLARPVGDASGDRFEDVRVRPVRHAWCPPGSARRSDGIEPATSGDKRAGAPPLVRLRCALSWVRGIATAIA